MLKYEIERLFRLGVNPFHIRARYRRFKPEKRWVNMPGGKIIQFKFYPHKIRKRSHNSGQGTKPTGLWQTFQISQTLCWRKRKWWQLTLNKKRYSVAQVAKMFGVDKRTVMKWLEEYEGDSVIPPAGWFRLPRSGYIRIKESAVKALLDE